MPEDFKGLWFIWSSLNREFNNYWQDMAPYDGWIADRDLWCTYLMISI